MFWAAFFVGDENTKELVEHRGRPKDSLRMFEVPHFLKTYELFSVGASSQKLYLEIEEFKGEVKVVNANDSTDS